MRSVTYSMAVSLDGYVVGPDGSADWTAPDEEVFNLATDEIRKVGVHLLGRRLYDTTCRQRSLRRAPKATGSACRRCRDIAPRHPGIRKCTRHSCRR